MAFLLVLLVLIKEFLVPHFDPWVETSPVQLELRRQKAPVQVRSWHLWRHPEGGVFGDVPERKTDEGMLSLMPPYPGFAEDVSFVLFPMFFSVLFLLFKSYFGEIRLTLLSLPNVMT